MDSANTDGALEFRCLEDVQKYNHSSLLRYFKLDWVFASIHSVLVILMIVCPDYADSKRRLLKFMTNTSRVLAFVKIVTSLYVVPMCTFAGTCKIFAFGIFNENVYDPIKPIGDAEYGKGHHFDKSALASRRNFAKTIMKVYPKYKIRLFYRSLFLIYIVALALDTEHGYLVLADYFLATLCFCACVLGTLMHYIFFPEPQQFGIAHTNISATAMAQHPSLRLAAVIHVSLLVGGVSFGNYLALLDWYQPYTKYPVAQYVGVYLGHLGGTTMAYLSIVFRDHLRKIFPSLEPFDME